MWLGTRTDGVWRVDCPANASAEHDDSRVTFHDFPNGARAATIYGSSLTGVRTWTTSRGALRPGDAELLKAFATHTDLYTGRGPVRFIPPGGERVNVLSREESLLVGSSSWATGFVQTTDGPHYGSVNTGNQASRVRVASAVPLPAKSYGDRVLTVSVYARGQVSLGVWPRDAGGNGGSGYQPTASGPSDRFGRVSWVFDTGHPLLQQDGNVYVDLDIGGNFTRPAVTYGRDLWAWGEGTQIPSVVVQQTGTEIQWAGSQQASAPVYSKASFKISELRNG